MEEALDLSFDRLLMMMIKYHENLCSVSRVVPCGRIDEQTDEETERHDEANGHFLQFLRKSFVRCPL